jgi:adenine-specific DNA-methyltransferase
MSQKIDDITHGEDTRKNIPTAELQSLMQKSDLTPIQLEFSRRNIDLDPQMIWRGKEIINEDILNVQASPLYIQEKVHPKFLIENLYRGELGDEEQIDLFGDFNGLPSDDAKTEFYKHEGHWSNRLILGDALQVMTSLLERESLRGQVQTIFLDPPYGIKFNSNFQWSTTTRDVKDGKVEHITREPEQVKAFRDTWKDGIHSYLTYLRDRMIISRELLSTTGSIFVQIGDENVHRVRMLLDEVFGEDNYVSSIQFTKSSAGMQSSSRVASISDTLLWYAKDASSMKYRKVLEHKGDGYDSQYGSILLKNGKSRRLTKDEISKFPHGIDTNDLFQADNLTKPGPGSKYEVKYNGESYTSGKRWWGTPEDGMQRLIKAARVIKSGKSLRYVRKFNESRYASLSNIWTGFLGQTNPIYVVQTNTDIVKRCILMTSDPGDLVLDPTCGSGTTAYVAEYWGRRWITIDTSRVALALARTRIMGAKLPYFYLSDSDEGFKKESELSKVDYVPKHFSNNIKHGFVYNRIYKITPSVISNNSEIDVIFEKYEEKLEELLNNINSKTKSDFARWTLPLESEENWSENAQQLLSTYWDLIDKRQNEIDKSINQVADSQYLYDQPLESKKIVRVAGPFTVESLSPHKSVDIDENDELLVKNEDRKEDASDFASMVLENLKISGVQQSNKEDKIEFESLTPWPGEYVSAEGKFLENGTPKRAAILIGPEFGTVSRPDLVAATREAADGDFDVLVSLAFNYDAHSSEFNKLGRVPVLKARMNADLHMSNDLKNTGKGNLFVIFGEPDIDIKEVEDENIVVQINGVDVFSPMTGEVRSDDKDGIACWFIDTNYNEESFFVRHAYFLGANDPYDSLKRTLSSDIDEESWESINSDISRPFKKPSSGRIAVKVINHLGDEVMKVYKVD